MNALRQAADGIRQQLRHGGAVADVAGAIIARAGELLSSAGTPSLQRVINATGVIVHTNLGRAPLSETAARAVARLASGYTNLEYDLSAGARGRRDVHAERLLCRLTGAEAACVVNNNAAATLITLAALAAGREVIVSRGELVEIGGGFRVPDVMAQSGAILREVGTTNRTRAADYAAAISDRTAAILRIHPSNFRIEGFTERPTLEDLAGIARRFEIPVLEDLGSGHLDSGLETLRDEPGVMQTLRAGADVVMFSGDKLLGGPQAGIITGRQDSIERIRRHPLMRALRVDKMTYAALEATLEAHAAERLEDVPVLRMIGMSADGIRERTERMAEQLAGAGITAGVVAGFSTVGGGSVPGSKIPTWLLRIQRSDRSANTIEGLLRAASPPLIARIEDDAVVLDLRTVPAAEDGTVGQILAAVLR